jgi:modulator of FtsH protease
MEPVRTNDNVFGNAPGQVAGTLAPESQRVLRNTYLLLALTMLPTIIGAWVGIQLTPIMVASPWITLFAMLGSMIGLQIAIVRFRDSAIGIGLLLLLTLLMGVFLGPLLNVALQLKNGMQLVGYAAAGTGAIFFGMGMLAATIKRDLAPMGKFLFVGMIALLVAGIANMFFQIPALALAISTLVIVVFSLYLLYDLNRIMRGGETNYVLATTGVYISLLAIFSHLLNLLMAFSGEKD